MTKVPALFSNPARQVLQREVGEARSADEIALSLERAFTALHIALAPLISSLGFCMLVRRALNLAARDFPFLIEINIVVAKEDCVLHGLREALDGRDRNEAVDGSIVILAHVFSLLVLFIGENLAWRKISEICPEISLLEMEDSSEKVE